MHTVKIVLTTTNKEVSSLPPEKILIIHQIPCDKNAKAVLISIQTQTKGSHLIVGSLYCPPNKTSDEYTTSMLKVIDQARHSKRDIIWLGSDLKLNDINWNDGTIESNNQVL